MPLEDNEDHLSKEFKNISYSILHNKVPSIMFVSQL